MTRRYWARVEYDGTDFFGFQVQAQARTVQGELEHALEVVTQNPTRVIGAGRTDRGVHARGQVIAFSADWRHELADLHRALNAVLAADVVIAGMGLAPEGFHPRFDAVRRFYRYSLLEQQWRSPLERRTAWHVTERLDVAQMTKASQCLIGTHDFGTFGRAPQGENTIRTVLRAEWQRRGSLLDFDVEANAFLYRMVRSIVGTLHLVGSGRLSPEDFEAILRAQDRSQVRQVAPAQGLCLMQVDYATAGGVLQ